MKTQDIIENRTVVLKEKPWLEEIKGKLTASEYLNASDKELHRCLDGCVGNMFPFAQIYRDAGLLK